MTTNIKIEQAINDTLEIIKTYIDASIQRGTGTTIVAKDSTLLKLRKANKTTIPRIAVLLNKPASYVTDLENGRIKLLIDDALKIAMLYGVSADSLFVE